MNNIINTRRARLTWLSFLAALFLGCTSSTPMIDTGPDAVVTFDGLHKVKGSRADEAWARPGLDLSGYSKIKLQSVGIEYRPVDEKRHTWRARTGGGTYEVTESQKERLRTILAEAFRDELSRSNRFTLVNESGPDVLLIRGALLDVVSYVPSEPVGRVDIFLRAVGEATLVLEIRDSITDAILVRAVDRKAAENIGGTLQKSNRVTNAADVRRLAKRWASALRKGLDEFAGPAN